MCNSENHKQCGGGGGWYGTVNTGVCSCPRYHCGGSGSGGIGGGGGNGSYDSAIACALADIGKTLGEVCAVLKQIREAILDRDTCTFEQCCDALGFSVDEDGDIACTVGDEVKG